MSRPLGSAGAEAKRIIAFLRAHRRPPVLPARSAELEPFLVSKQQFGMADLLKIAEVL